MGLLVGDPHTFAYLTRKGDADTIGKWTMEQSNSTKIGDGLAALQYKLETTRTATEADKSFNWFIRVVNRLEDYPTSYVFDANDDQRSAKEQFIRSIFSYLAVNAFDHPKTEEILYRLKPESKHMEWLEEWEKSVAQLQTWRDEARPNKAESKLPATTLQSR
jgi:hypothetical protein